jgi:hypothetical protein
LVLDHVVRTKLLSAIEAQNLIVLCGAGLSVSAPSCLKGAVAVAQHCYDQYAPIEVLNPVLRDDLDTLAGHFHGLGTFRNLFINRLVPWGDLAGEPNAGHAAIGDFLLSGAAEAALSANFDVLIEQWCNQHKVAVRGALNGQEAVEFSAEFSPLLKFHGCMNRDREHTLWTQPQLLDPDTQARIASCRAWMDLHLPNRHILVVGFWTDWGYLNAVLDAAIQVGTAASVTVIDPLPTAQLQARAPNLWNVLTQVADFTHVPHSANDALDELRVEFSKVWTRKFYALGAPLYAADKGNPCPPALLAAPALPSDELYAIRRDAEGVPANHAARKHSPTPDASVTALAHLLLLDAGAIRTGSTYEILGRSVRVVHGAGQGLAMVQERFKAPPSTTVPDVVICAGAINQGVPAHVVRSGHGASVLRPAAGFGSHWTTLDEARVDLGI